MFIERRNEQRKQKERELNNNLKQKQEILAELKKLLEDTQNISASFDRLHELQNQWRSIGLVPSVYVDELWKNYHHHINNFYEIIKINKELRELDQKKNL
jgi:prolyl oligopeptidase PreP (S9A serine peptidase family)